MSSKKNNSSKKAVIKNGPSMTIHDRVRLIQKHINLAKKIGASKNRGNS